ncbi:sensor histidine kinase [Pseudofrankia sp. BMG5.37]|uniref:sensor histidine kinase n=1 Tax=Pseudofrankia sp. BMG5.37 TaxID=3050035 RepID=UPI0028948FEC|nr:sensor histidine kinase [Pseudofrankia sp. BMG5.37]MDT3444440.1 sensor histidine kinase [Pseudofrankia sp. BMG5.37]
MADPADLVGGSTVPGASSVGAEPAAPDVTGSPAGRGLPNATGDAASPASADVVVESWERREMLAYRIIPYVGLGLSVLLSALVPSDDGWSQVAVEIGLSVVAAGWMVWFRVLHPTWVGRRRLMTGYLVILLVLIATLVILAPWFGFFAFTGYLESTALLTGWRRMLGAVVTAMIVATSQVGGVPTSWGYLLLYVVVFGFNVGVAGTLTWFDAISTEQRAARGRAIAELGEANRRLQAALTENAGLHAQLVVQAREAGTLDERARLAREIHDTLAQGLTGIVTQLQAAEQAGARGHHLSTALRLARESLTEARRSVQALRPAELADAALPDALVDVAARWTQANGVPVEVSTTGPVVALHPEVEATVLRVAQESLANVARHAAATRVGLTLSYMSDVVTVDIRDDGVGFDTDTDVAGPGRAESGGDTRGGGFGLAAMRQRVARLAGGFSVESEPGAGTAVSATLPAIPAPRGDAETAGAKTAGAKTGRTATTGIETTGTATTGTQTAGRDRPMVEAPAWAVDA